MQPAEGGVETIVLGDHQVGLELQAVDLRLVGVEGHGGVLTGDHADSRDLEVLVVVEEGAGVEL
jgi:hypothetical protein